MTSTVPITEVQSAILDVLAGAAKALTAAQVRRIILGGPDPEAEPPEHIAVVVQPDPDAWDFWFQFNQLLPLGLIFPDGQRPGGGLFTYVITLAGKSALAAHDRRGFKGAHGAA